ncbi:hypothetical protein GEMRC1_004878 [Eukaryota sp. GEM-RC1]
MLGIQEKLKQMFPDRPGLSRVIGPRTNNTHGLCPEELVAVGAAVIAKNHTPVPSPVPIIEVTPLSYGLAVNETQMDVLIPRNTKLPASVKAKFKTMEDNQSSATFQVFEGEQSLVKDNSLVGEFTLEDLPLRPAGKVTFVVHLKVSVSMVLTFTAYEERNETNKKNIVVRRHHEQDDRDAIERSRNKITRLMRPDLNQ